MIDGIMDPLVDSLGVEGIGKEALLLWIICGVLGLVGGMIYIPQKVSCIRNRIDCYFSLLVLITF